MSSDTASGAHPGAAFPATGGETEQGDLFIVSAPSGAGKTTMVRALIERDPAIILSVSYTTREQRPRERPGTDYHFVSAAEFERLVATDALLEHARVFDHWYGTSRADVLHELEAGRDVMLEIDWQGAEQIRGRMPECVSVFVLPPARDTLQSRLRARGGDSEQIIARRLRDAVSDMTHYHEFDYLIFNADLDHAVEELHSIVRARRLTRPRQADRRRPLLDDLTRG